MLPTPYGVWVMDPIMCKSSNFKAEYEVAEAIYCQMLKRMEGNHNLGQPNIICGLHNLGLILIVYGKLEESERAFLRILEEIGGSLSPEDDMILLSQTLNNLALAKAFQGKYQEAELLLRRALHGQEQYLDDWHRDLLLLRNNLAMTLRRQNKAAEAQDLQERVVETCSIKYSYITEYQRNLEWIRS